MKTETKNSKITDIFMKRYIFKQQNDAPPATTGRGYLERNSSEAEYLPSLRLAELRGGYSPRLHPCGDPPAGGAGHSAKENNNQLTWWQLALFGARA